MNEIVHIQHAVNEAHKEHREHVALPVHQVEHLLRLFPRMINGMVDLPWTVEPPRHMAVLLARARHLWPGTVDCTDVSPSDWGTVMKLVFRYEGRERWCEVVDCCPDEHVSEVIKETIAWFIKGDECAGPSST